jgi:uncharacterized protein
MKIFDAHMHLPYTEEINGLDNSLEILKKEMKSNDIYGGIIIPDNIKNSGIGDLTTLLGLLKNEKNLFLLGTVHLNIDPIEEKISEINTLFKNNKIVGFKIFPGHDPIYPTDKRYIPFIKLCLEYKKPLVIHTGINSEKDNDCSKYNDPKYIEEIAIKYPNLKIIVVHYFWPKLDYCYNKLITFPNIYFDIAALADKEVIDITGEENIVRVLEKTPANRIIYGTDYAMCSMETHINLIKGLKFTDKEKEDIFFNNALKTYEISL